MKTHYRTALTAVGPDVPDLLDGGILILFADGAPPELAEVSVLHRVAEGPSTEAPRPGAESRSATSRPRSRPLANWPGPRSPTWATS